jgi:hypothetical protein
MMNCTNTMLLWDRATGEIFLKPWPERPGETKHAAYSSTLACWPDFRNESFQRRKSLLLQEFASLVVFDGLDPKRLHTVLLALPEWRSNWPERFKDG